MLNTPTHEIYNALHEVYEFFNAELFNNKLPKVIFTFTRTRRVMGYVSVGRWVNRSKQYVDELAVNPEYFAHHHPVEIWQTICHEQCHVFQGKFGKPGRRGYHNAEWARKMIEIGLMPSTTGRPGGEKTGEDMMDYVLFGGKFHEACKKLITKGLNLPWVDRYPVFRLDLPLVVYTDSGRPVELDNSLNPKPVSTIESDFKINSISEKAFNTVGSFSSISADEINAVIAQMLGKGVPAFSWAQSVEQESSDVSYNLSEGTAIFQARVTPKPGRVKYMCDSCLALVWGKPKLNIVCGDCDLAFKVQG